MNRFSISLAVALSLVACKKKEDGGSAPKTNEPATGTPPATGSAPAAGSQAMATGSGATPTEAPKPLTGAALADKYKACVDQLNAAKYDDFAKDCIDDSYTGHMGGMDVKLADLKQHFTDMHAAFPDLKHTPQVILVNGRTLYGVELVQGTHEGTLKGMHGMPDVPATHKKVGFMFFHKLAISDANKATEEWAFMDPATMMGQLGLLPKEAPPKRAAMDKGLDGAPIVAVAADDAKEKANLDAEKKINDAFNAHKPADMLAGVTDDFVESDQAADKDHVGKKENEKGIKDFLNAFSDLKITPESTAAGDFVVSIGTLEGTNDHDMGKMKKTGKKVSIKYAELTQYKDGKAAHLWRFYNSMDFAMQLGLMPMPGGDKAGAAPGGDKAGEKPADKGGDKKPADKKPAKK